MLVMIDNYDSFTYNLVQYFYQLGVNVKVYRNDEVNLQAIEQLNPKHICISPGPGNPSSAGISLEVISHFLGKVPLLGVCLGHQAIAQAAGAVVQSAKSIMHGKVSDIYVQDAPIGKKNTLFKHLPKTFKVTRYHSLAVDAQTLPQDWLVTAKTLDEEIMALQHTTLPCYGVQFHPEAILTEHGHALLKNFLDA